jgi:hypothetical protein
MIYLVILFSDLSSISASVVQTPRHGSLILPLAGLKTKGFAANLVIDAIKGSRRTKLKGGAQGIDINQAENDKTYMKVVIEDLRLAKGKDDAIKILQDIGQQLLDGTYPRAGR